MKNKIKFGLCGAAALALASSVYATPVDGIRFSTDGTTWTSALTFMDGGAGDLSGPAGVNDGTMDIHVNVGSFNMVITTSFTYPAVGSLGRPIMDLHVGGLTTGAGTLFVEFTSTGFTPAPSGAIFTSIAPNEPGVTEQEITRIGDGGTAFAAAGITGGTLGPIDTGSEKGTLVVPSSMTSYTITLQDKFVSSGAGLTLSTDDRLGVPDGGNTLMLLGSALSVLGLGVFRKSRKA